jgi:hypothetical protein
MAKVIIEVEQKGCIGCMFLFDDVHCNAWEEHVPSCSSGGRADGKEVIFIEVEDD